MQEKPQSLVTRKQFLRALLAGGGALAVAVIPPGKWLKPILRVGVLPAHTQTSDPATSTPTRTSTPPGTNTPTEPGSQPAPSWP
jgi:hypothetical protein